MIGAGDDRSEDRRSFDDILALGDLPLEALSRCCEMMAVGGLLLQGRRSAFSGPALVDLARVHYDEPAFLGTRERDLSTAFAPVRQRFDVRAGGVALVHGAGGAMGRIHVHRLLQLNDGPDTVIASSRKGRRLADLQSDFGPLAQAAGWLAPNGLLAVFAGFPYGGRLPIDLGAVALHGLRITGFTGCSVDDMRGVLRRVERGELDLSVISPRSPVFPRCRRR